MNVSTARKSVAMTRDQETQAAVMALLPKVKAVLNLYEIGQPLVAQGFTETEIFDVLINLTHQKVIELLPGNQLRVLRSPTCSRS
ncbi:hypothetical protein J2W42_005881 [Rhizobium tibeticum]|uniref:Uncharacterized protein n=1 Tax=Rhizobium tibeticum TaxID=501024 RepID=A0A1H8VB33_9HYPH|nr:hypothetical protein [Rhizobium tibeticum]MDP9813010.1 hypothetical protein [Rhizobium tibeticum]SEI18779.1 hypothetical protein RTCCBAU85039_6007 [Rhizobium tibeticum]SEP12649.1 hypothetical protein SAMN05216228_10413 [Rhizobium tibeticum]